MFPRLEERKKNKGKQLSGGEQQMLAIARALVNSGQKKIHGVSQNQCRSHKESRMMLGRYAN